MFQGLMRSAGSVATPPTNYCTLYINSSDNTPHLKFSSGTDTSLVGVPSTRTITAGAGLTGGGDLSADRTVNVIANADGSIVVNADDIQIGVLATDAQHGTRGGGTLHANVVAAGAAGFMTGADKTILNNLNTNAVLTTRTITAGNGLTGGGDLSANRTISALAADATITVAGGGLAVGVITDANHGNRGNGSLHSQATGAADGFLPAAMYTSVNNYFGLPVINTADPPYNTKADDDGTHTGGTDNAAGIQAAYTAAIALGGAHVVISSLRANNTFPGRYAVRSGLTISGNGVATHGVGSSYTTDVGNYIQSGGTWIVWRGASGGTVFTLSPANTGASAIPLLGCRMDGLSIDCRDLRSGSDTGATQAGIGLLVKATFGAHFSDLFIVDSLTAGIDLQALTPGTIAGTDTHGVARSIFERICIRQLDGAVVPGIGLRLAGSVSANANFNMFSTFQIMYVGSNTGKPAIQFNNSDSNSFDNIACNRGGSGTTNWGIEILGSNSTAAEVCRANEFKSVSPGPNGLIVCGTAGGRLPDGTAAAGYNFTFPARDNDCFPYSTENGEPVPFRCTGSDMDYQTTGGSTGRLGRGVIKSLSATVTVANAETQVIGYTLPANALIAGSTYRFKLHGLVSNTTAASTTIHRVRLGAASLGGAVVATATYVMGTTARTNIPFTIDCEWACYSVGTSGTALGQLSIAANTATALAATAPATVAVAIDTTVARVLELTTISGATTTTWAYHAGTIEVVKL